MLKALKFLFTAPERRCLRFALTATVGGAAAAAAVVVVVVEKTGAPLSIVARLNH